MAETNYVKSIKDLAPRAWSRNTPADGDFLNRNLIQPTQQKDEILASAVDDIYNRALKVYDIELSNVSADVLDVSANAKAAVDAATSVIDQMNVIVNNMVVLSATDTELAERIGDINIELNKKLDKSIWDNYSGNFVTSSDASMVDNKKYALTTSGWSEITEGGGGGGSNNVYVPNIDAAGNLKYELSASEEFPEEVGPWNIKGPEGETGPEGFSPTITLTPVGQAAGHDNGGTQVEITFKDGETTVTSAYTAWNGNNGGGGGSYTAGTDLKIDENIISVDTNGNTNNTATNNRNFVEGSWTVTSGYNCHAEGVATSAFGYGVHAQGMWTCFSSTDGQTNSGLAPIYWGDGAGATVEGYCNATTACPMSGTGNDYGPIHGGILKVIGNGYREHELETEPANYYPSDALILYRDGSLSVAGKISAAGVELGAEPDLSYYIPYSASNLPIGSNNTATNNSIAIGSNNIADNLGYAVGQSNTALKRSLAFGVNNYANDISLAIGYNNYASGNNNSNQSAVNIAIGYGNSAADHAAAFINICTAQNYAFAAGHANVAIDNSVAFGRNTSANFYSFDFGHSNYVKNYSYAFGRGLHYEGQREGSSQYGAFVIGGWNATTSYATTADAPLFIIGNGSNNNPSDAFIVYRDGTVTAKQFQNADGTETINGNTYNFTGVDNIEILPNAATAVTANFLNDNVLRFILES